MSNKTVGQGGQRKFSRAEREQQIIDILGRRWAAVSTYRLAKELGMSNSPHFKGIVYSMLRDEKIGGFRSLKANGRDVYYWYRLDRDELFGQQRLGGM